MPATRYSVLDVKPITELRPGESGLALKDDPYYGKVDVGPAPMSVEEKDKEFEKKERARISQMSATEKPAAEEKLTKDLASRKVKREQGEHVEPFALKAGEATPDLVAKLEVLQTNIEEGAHALDGDEQDHVEVLTGKRLQQRPAEPPREPKDADAEKENEAAPKASAKTEPKIPTKS